MTAPARPPAAPPPGSASPPHRDPPPRDRPAWPAPWGPPVAVEPGGVRAEVALLRGEVRAVGDQVRALAGEVRRQARTDWPALLTAGGLAVTVAVGLGALALNPLEAAADAARAADASLRADHRALAGAVRDHATGEHPASAARSAAAERRLGRLEGRAE